MLEKLYSPESLGVPSKGIAALIKAMKQARCNTHGILIMKNGKKIAEAYSPEYGVDSTHRMYSVSKTFTSAAIGILIGEGKLSLSDKVFRFFPDKCPADLHPLIAEAEVRDLLMMATPFNDTTYRVEMKDWTRSFFNTEPSHHPGTLFNYDTSATLILDAIVERVSGMPFEQYLFEKALCHAGWKKAPRCVKSPDGVSWGGSGILCTLRELASFSQLFLDGGIAPDSTPCIPSDYIKEATSKQIANETDNDFGATGCVGYGYQIWITENGFTFLGMGNQLSIFHPEKQLLFCCFSDDQGNDSSRKVIFDSLKEFVVDPAGEKPLPADPEGEAELQNAYKLLGMPLPLGEKHSGLEKTVSGKEFALAPNDMGISSIRLDFEGEHGSLTLGTPRGSRTLTFGLGAYDDSVFPETHYSGITIGTPLGRGYRCHTAGVWGEPDKLILRCYINDDYLGNFTATVAFKNGKPSLLFRKTAEWFLNEYNGFACAL